jgi:hypothetical protein
MKRASVISARSHLRLTARRLAPAGRWLGGLWGPQPLGRRRRVNGSQCWYIRLSVTRAGAGYREGYRRGTAG